MSFVVTLKNKVLTMTFQLDVDTNRFTLCDDTENFYHFILPIDSQYCVIEILKTTMTEKIQLS